MFILENITEEQHKALVAVDEFKRTPLHYAAQYGLKLLTKVVIDYMKRWNLIDSANDFDGPEWKDCDGVTPLSACCCG